MNRILLLFVCVSCIIIGLTNCNKTNTVASAQLRVFNIDPTIQPQDIYLNGVERISGLTYGIDTNYVAIPPGTYNIQIAPANTNTFNTNYNIDFSSGKNYMMFLLNINSAIQTEAFDENILPMGYDTAEFRFLPFSPNAPTMSVAIKSDTASYDTTYVIFTGRTFNDAYATRNLAQFTRIVSGPYTFKLRYLATDSTTVTIDSMHINFIPKNSYTIYASGYFDSTGVQPFKIDTLHHN